ncbi:maltose acetyltransferase domain-containing protein [Muriicola soli]|uniref:Maltose/galactoside acetyltransferase domain-containing protein n=1 Tax=Muriicola soli TaxID=2507538 RepID=A0A411E8Z4_9FLAO|nr:hypothetical protein EQY75_05355 [Muriicola soli]
MTEKEKMLKGMNYDSRDPELIKMYHRARRLLKRYNNLNSELAEERDLLLAELFEFKGKGVWVEPPFIATMGKIFP